MRTMRVIEPVLSDIDVANSGIIIVGASEYSDDKLANLWSVDGNLETLPDILRKRTNIQDIELYRNPSEWSELFVHVREKFKKCKDTVIFYFSGHGILFSNELYLALGGTVHDDPESSSAIPIRKIKEYVNQPSSAKRKILILDCCFSGAAVQTMGGLEDPAEIDAYVQRQYSDIKGAAIISACAHDRLALAPEGDRFTKFTSHLIQVLESECTDSEDHMTVGQLFTALKTSIRKENETVADGELRVPEPTSLNIGDIGRLRLIINEQLVGSVEKPALATVLSKDHFQTYLSVVANTASSHPLMITEVEYEIDGLGEATSMTQKILGMNSLARLVFGMSAEGEKFESPNDESFTQWMDAKDIVRYADDQERLGGELFKDRMLFARVPLKFNEHHPFFAEKELWPLMITAAEYSRDFERIVKHVTIVLIETRYTGKTK